MKFQDDLEHFESHSSLPPEFFEHYASGYEAQRLQSGSSQIELARTQELVMRYVPPLPAVILDVGGGPGVYACWLAKQGYEVHLVDATPLHVELARQASQAQPDAPLASIEVGGACSLKLSDESWDEESGFLYERTLPGEEPLWLSPFVVANFSDQKRREHFLALSRWLEEEPSLLG